MRRMIINNKQRVEKYIRENENKSQCYHSIGNIYKEMYIEKQDNKINRKLNLMKLQKEFPDELAIKVIYELVCCRIDVDTPFYHIKANIEELCCVEIISLTNDDEIIARWCDMLLCAKKDVANNSLLAYRYYIIAYKESHDWSLAIRAFTLVKQKRGLYSRYMDEICDDAEYVLNKVKYPNQFKTLILIVISIVSQDKLCSVFEEDIKNTLSVAKANLDFDNAITSVEILEILGVISLVERKKQKSFLLESDADNILSSAEENTFYPTVLRKYSLALKEISSLPDLEVEKERISQKMLKEQNHSAEMMSHFTIPIKINRWDIYEKMINVFNIDSPIAAFSAIINFPIFPKEGITQQREMLKQNASILYENFSTNIWKNAKGATISIKDGDNAIDDAMSRFAHLMMIEYLSVLVWIFNSAGECNTEPKVIDRFLRINKSRFIPKDRVALYVQGLWAGFMGDYSLATHILLPQIENSFRYIAEQHRIITTQLDKKIQHENMLGGVLDKIKPVTDPDLWADLKMFLIESEGFRNQALHGLSSMRELENNGIYFWWLCLKMIHQTDYYFGFDK
ncbi:MAG: hypothetical protein ACRCUJ_06030 [Phocaeicola sp.]